MTDSTLKSKTQDWPLHATMPFRVYGSKDSAVMANAYWKHSHIGELHLTASGWRFYKLAKLHGREEEEVVKVLWQFAMKTIGEWKKEALRTLKGKGFIR